LYNHVLSFGLQSLNCGPRVGNFSGKRDAPEHPHHLGHADAAQLFTKALTAELAPRNDPVGPTRFEVVWGVSDSNWPLYDIAHGERAIGYKPEQRSVVPESEWRPAKL
jgi:hypothetical protein